MKLYLDEMISPAVARGLRNRGHDVVATAERGAPGASDAAQLAFAIRERRALVTYNIGDFITLSKAAAYSGCDHWGIILISDRSVPGSRVGQLVRSLDLLLRDETDEDALKNRTIFLRPPTT